MFRQRFRPGHSLFAPRPLFFVHCDDVIVDDRYIDLPQWDISSVDNIAAANYEVILVSSRHGFSLSRTCFLVTFTGDRTRYVPTPGRGLLMARCVGKKRPHLGCPADIQIVQ